MSEFKKRKTIADAGRDGHEFKRSKGGSGGRWQTPHQKARAATAPSRGGGKIEPGDMGIWITCIKGKEGAATEELKGMFDNFAERFYHISDGPANSEGDANRVEEDDIESSIQKEIDLIATKQGPAKLFTPVYLDVQCVLFFKTNPPILPADFVHRICEDARQFPEKRMVRFVNRLTPMTLMGRATEKGLEDVGRTVLGEHFQLAGDETQTTADFGGNFPSYAIRPTIRNHSSMKREAVIDLVASLVGPNHKVNLTKPDRVIIVDIYQTVCGMSVVGDDWEGLKRYNLAEIYQPTPKPSIEAGINAKLKGPPEAIPKDEATEAEATIMTRRIE